MRLFRDLPRMGMFTTGMEVGMSRCIIQSDMCRRILDCLKRGWRGLTRLNGMRGLKSPRSRWMILGVGIEIEFVGLARTRRSTVDTENVFNVCWLLASCMFSRKLLAVYMRIDEGGWWRRRKEREFDVCFVHSTQTHDNLAVSSPVCPFCWPLPLPLPNHQRPVRIART